MHVFENNFNDKEQALPPLSHFPSVWHYLENYKNDLLNHVDHWLADYYNLKSKLPALDELRDCEDFLNQKLEYYYHELLPLKAIKELKQIVKQALQESLTSYGNILVYGDEDTFFATVKRHISLRLDQRFQHSLINKEDNDGFPKTTL